MPSSEVCVLMMRMFLVNMAAILGVLTGVAEIGALAQTTDHCAYIDWLNRPKQTGFVDELLGPIDQVKNGPYAAWTTKIAYLTVF